MVNVDLTTSVNTKRRASPLIRMIVLMLRRICAMGFLSIGASCFSARESRQQ